MRLVSCEHDDRERWGVELGDGVVLAPLESGWPSDLAALLDHGPEATREAAETLAGRERARIDAEAVTRRAPLPRPRRNVMCLGLNYAAHAEESMRAKGRELQLPEHPVVFTKSPGSVTGPDAAVPLDPAVTTELDWEVELAVVLGRRLYKADATAAQAAIAGYTVVNDLSARDLQFRHKQFFLGKSINGGCPMGPALVTADEVPNPQALGLQCRVNGVLKQDGHTGDQVFGVLETLRRLSAIMTLEPGDIIATGTPAGVGFARTPPEFLAVGDRVTCWVEGLGTLRNHIVAAD